jgi:enediyne biosynthesis protein E5
MVSAKPLLPSQWHSADPRLFQIASLTSLYAISLIWYPFALDLRAIPLAFGGAMAAQFVGGKLRGAAFEWRSAAITATSIALLLRTDRLGWYFLCGALAIASKFLIHWRGKHLFNPSNGAIVALLLAGAPVWVSPGQWGHAGWLTGLLITFAALVLGRSGRFDIAFAFLASHAAMLLGRALWLGDPLTIPLHQLQTVSILVFSAFMVTDPRATPDRREMRMIFAFCVAALALFVQIRFQLTGAPLYALTALSPLVPMLDALRPGQRFEWQKAKGTGDAAIG